MLYAHLNSSTDINIHMSVLRSNLVEKSDMWLVSMLREQIDVNVVNKVISILKEHAKEKKQKLSNIKLIVNDTADLSKLKNLDGIKVFSINFYRMLTYYYKYQEHPKKTDQQFNNEYIGKNNKALFLMGKPHQPHRTPVLVELINRNLKDKLVYSWSPGSPKSHVFKLVKNIVTKIFEGEIDFYNFSQLYAQRLDISEQTPIFNLNETCYHYTGFPFDVSLYKNTSLSIISETNHSSYLDINFPWTTEKLWRAIANRHPFILVGECGIITKLRKLGYETWDSFLKYDQYTANSFWNITDRKAVEMAVDNIEYFLSSDKCIDTIKQLTKKNADLMDQHVSEEIDKVFGGDLELFRNFVKESKYLNLSEGKAFKNINKNSIENDKY